MSDDTKGREAREAFEHWASDEGKWPKAVERLSSGPYILSSTSLSWIAWQAAWSRRASLPPAPVLPAYRATEREMADDAHSILKGGSLVKAAAYLIKAHRLAPADALRVAKDVAASIALEPATPRPACIECRQPLKQWRCSACKIASDVETSAALAEHAARAAPAPELADRDIPAAFLHGVDPVPAVVATCPHCEGPAAPGWSADDIQRGHRWEAGAKVSHCHMAAD